MKLRLQNDLVIRSELPKAELCRPTLLCGKMASKGRRLTLPEILAPAAAKVR